MQFKRFRWLDVAAVAVVLMVAAALWQSSWSPAEQQGDILREALTVATDECYASYRGVELQACLAGAMQAHLQALGEHDGGRDSARHQPDGHSL